MGKRSNEVKRKNDAYMTWDKRALLPLLPHLESGSSFVEPCAGKTDLIKQLQAQGHICLDALDIDPVTPLVRRGDATEFVCDDVNVDYFITNPPWTRSILHHIIMNLSDQRPTWLLFDADWCHTLQAIPYMSRCVKVVSIGRLKWIEGSPHDGKDNCAWYLFDYRHYSGPVFYPRLPKQKKVTELLKAA